MREKNSLSSLSPPLKPSVPAFSPDYMDVPKRGREQAGKEQWGESLRMSRGQGNEKNIDRGDKV